MLEWNDMLMLPIIRDKFTPRSIGRRNVGVTNSQWKAAATNSFMRLERDASGSGYTKDSQECALQPIMHHYPYSGPNWVCGTSYPSSSSERVHVDAGTRWINFTSMTEHAERRKGNVYSPASLTRRSGKNQLPALQEVSSEVKPDFSRST